MLEVVDYRVDGMSLRVRLKCSCGGRKIVKVKEDGKEYYSCAKCGSRATLAELKRNATTYWQGRPWEVECEEPKTHSARVYVNYPATLEAQAHRYASPCCTLTGRCVELSISGLVFVAENFKVSYFEPLSTEHQHAVVKFSPPVRGLPPVLHGSIVGIKFREEELPLCNIRVAFRDLLGPEESLVSEHIEEVRGRITEWTADET